MSDLKPLVTILTITRNRAHIIPRAIESILNQTYTNIEYIIVDGASEDNTREVVSSYKDSRIKYIALPENGSVIRSTNVGFSQANGEFITFLDDDDEYVETKIEKQVNLMMSLPETYGFVYCWMDYYDDAANKFLYTHKAELRGDVGCAVVESPVLSGTPTYFFRRNAFEELGGWRDHIGIISDWELAARACQHYLVDYVPESLVKVHINHGAKRMSDEGFYKGILRKNIKFHIYFLDEFRRVFEAYPKKKATHLYTISRSYFLLGEWRMGWRYYKRLLDKDLTLKYLLMPVYCLIHSKSES